MKPPAGNRKLWMLVASLVTLLGLALIGWWSGRLDPERLGELADCVPWLLAAAIGGNAAEHGAAAMRPQASGGTP